MKLDEITTDQDRLVSVRRQIDKDMPNKLSPVHCFVNDGLEVLFEAIESATCTTSYSRTYQITLTETDIKLLSKMIRQKKQQLNKEVIR